MKRIRTLIVDGKEVYHLGHKPIASGDRCRARLRNDSNDWETFEGVIRTAEELGIAAATSYADELWLSIPGFHDYRISQINSSTREIERI